MKALLTACLLSSALATPALAQEFSVVTSIKPVHALVASVMAGAGTPHLIVKGGASPHTYSMKPSDAKALEGADLVFWVGHDMEVFLRGPIETLGANAKVITLDESHDLITLPFREGGAFDAHDHGEEEHEDEHEHEGEHEEEHEHEEAHDHEEEHEHEHEDEHEHDEIDTHIWLDPLNAKAMVHEIEEALVAADPDNASIYTKNAQETASALDALVVEVKATLAPVSDRPFIVFHDAYQYFEKRFDVTAAGSITVSPDVIPGVKRIAEIHQKVTELDATCVFAEPQFEPKLVTVVTEGTNAKAGVLDPLGTGIDNGPNLYFTLIRNMASALKDCLQR